mgnify:CR=1 FL=1
MPILSVEEGYYVNINDKSTVKQVQKLHDLDDYYLTLATSELVTSLAEELLGGPVERVPYTHLRAHETDLDLVCRLLLEKKKTKTNKQKTVLSERIYVPTDSSKPGIAR